MSGSHTYAYPRPMKTVDAVVFAVDGDRLEFLAIKRGNDPYAGAWALPGGFVDEGEPLDVAVARELEEETNLAGIRLRQFGTFGDPERDPRGWTISTVYLGLVSKDAVRPCAGDDAAETAWLPARPVPDMAFDHTEVVTAALDALHLLTDCRGVGADVLPERFAVDAFANLYEVLRGEAIDHDEFVQRMVALGVIELDGDMATFADPARVVL